MIRYNKLLFSERYILSNLTINEIKHKFKNNIISYFSDALKSSVNVGKDEIDEAHIIYNYLKSKESACKYITIPEQWINDMNSLSIDRTIDEFISDNL